ncbi:hypothetical protein HDU77_008057 [Chytriomyces hyalinus]|nr:hypothetical protein HDU77_008057 [Chytriomyces hyalinus]
MNATQPLLSSSHTNAASRSSLIRYYPDNFDEDNDSGSDEEYAQTERERHRPFESREPSNQSPQQQAHSFKDPLDRKPQDSLFGLLFAFAFLCFALAAINAVRLARHQDGEELRNSVYMALKSSFGVLVGVTIASIMAAVIWILSLTAFVKPIVWGSIVAIPILCLGIFTFILTDALLGKAHDPVYLDPQYNWMIFIAVLFLIASVTSGSFLYRERRNIDRAINIIHLACQILWETPSIFTFSLGLMAVYSVFSFLWAFAFSHLFLPRSELASPDDPLTLSTEGAILFFVFMHFWATAVLSSIEKMTISGVVGQWYFGRTIDETFDEDLVARSFRGVVGSGFGSVCLASLIVGGVEGCQFVVRNVRKNSRGSTQPFLSLVDSCMDCIGRTVSQISSYTLIYCGLTGAPLCSGAYSCTRLFRRNLVMGMATAGITRAVLFFGASAAAGGVGAGAFFYSARGTGSPYAWVVGGVGTLVPFYVVRFMSQVIQNTVDATFICYMLDVDSNANNCQEAHEIFENELGL